MNKTCKGCTDRGKFFRCPPCATCKHEGGGANGTEDNFRPYIEQDAAYALLAAAKEQVSTWGGHTYECCYSMDYDKRLGREPKCIKQCTAITQAIADAKGDA